MSLGGAARVATPIGGALALGLAVILTSTRPVIATTLSPNVAALLLVSAAPLPQSIFEKWGCGVDASLSHSSSCNT